MSSGAKPSLGGAFHANCAGTSFSVHIGRLGLRGVENLKQSHRAIVGGPTYGIGRLVESGGGLALGLRGGSDRTGRRRLRGDHWVVAERTAGGLCGDQVPLGRAIYLRWKCFAQWDIVPGIRDRLELSANDVGDLAEFCGGCLGLVVPISPCSLFAVEHASSRFGGSAFWT